MDVTVWVDALLALPPSLAYLLVALVIGAESMGVPLPGEFTLMTVALLGTQVATGVSPLGLASAAAAGAIIGDSLGYAIGRRYGRRLLGWTHRRFPGHVSIERLAAAEWVYAHWGAWAVVGGRFVAVLRVVSGPLTGSLRMPYPRFLVANATGGLMWAFGVTYLVTAIGAAAHTWVTGGAWVLFAVVMGGTVAVAVGLRRPIDAYVRRHAALRPAHVEQVRAGYTTGTDAA